MKEYRLLLTPLLLLAICLFILETGNSLAMMAANIDAAKKVASKECAACHKIPGLRRSKSAEGAPSFPELANNPSLNTWEPLQARLSIPHWPETEKILTSTDITNLTGYILSFTNDEETNE